MYASQEDSVASKLGVYNIAVNCIVTEMLLVQLILIGNTWLLLSHGLLIENLLYF